MISHYVTGQIENDETKRNEEILLRFREEAVNYKRNRFRMHNQSAPLAHHQMLPGLINPERFS